MVAPLLVILTSTATALACPVTQQGAQLSAHVLVQRPERRLRAGDSAAFEQNLRRAGLPDYLVTAWVAAEARERIRLRQQGSDAPATFAGDRPREVAAAPAASNSNDPGERIDPLGRDLEFIDPSRRERARAISRDYDALIAEVRRGAGQMLTNSEKEMIATLEAERHRDLEGFLTPEELAGYEMVKSPLYERLTRDMQELAPTAEEFRAIFAAEKAFTDRFEPGATRRFPSRPGDRDAVGEARAAADEQLLQQLGAERFAEYDRSRHREYRELAQLVRRVNLPTELAVEVFSMREFVAAESNRIFRDTGMTSAAKRAALADLASGTRDLIRERLGAEAGSAYLQSADRWLNAVENGATVSFRGDATLVRGLPPGNRPPAPVGGN